MSTPRRRWFRYTLRTMLVVITVLAVWLGIQVNRARSHRDACRELGRLGDIVYWHQYPDQSPGIWVRRDAELPGPKWLREQIGDYYFLSVVWVTLSPSMVTTTPTTATHECTDDDLKPLEEISELRQLEIESPLVTDEGMRHLTGLKDVRMLTLQLPKLTDVGLRHFEGLRTIEQISLCDTQVTAEGIERLQKALPTARLIVEPALK